MTSSLFLESALLTRWIDYGISYNTKEHDKDARKLLNYLSHKQNAPTPDEHEDLAEDSCRFQYMIVRIKKT